MTSNKLKLIALILMTVDHVGAVLFPQIIVLRVIGRLSFPLFAFLLVEGFKHTRSFTNYLIRILAFGFISEIIYDLTFHGSFSLNNRQNIMFTLALGLVAMKLIQLVEQKKSPWYLLILQMFVILAMALVMNVDYGLYGILTIVIFYVSDVKKNPFVLSALLLLLNISYLPVYGIIQAFSIFSVLILAAYNGKRGRKLRKFDMYVYYPAHLLLLFIISQVVL